MNTTEITKILDNMRYMKAICVNEKYYKHLKQVISIEPYFKQSSGESDLVLAHFYLGICQGKILITDYLRKGKVLILSTKAGINRDLLNKVRNSDGIYTDDLIEFYKYSLEIPDLKHMEEISRFIVTNNHLYL